MPRSEGLTSHALQDGDVPQEDLLRLVRAETLDERTQQPLLHGMQNLVSALTEVLGVTLKGEEEPRH